MMKANFPPPSGADIDYQYQENQKKLLADLANEFKDLKYKTLRKNDISYPVNFKTLYEARKKVKYVDGKIVVVRP